MTDDDLTLLFACAREAIRNTGDDISPAEVLDQLGAMGPAAIACMAQEALFFRHITRNAEHLPDPEPYPGQATRYGWSVQWGAWGDQHTTLEEAIDHDMKDAKK